MNGEKFTEAFQETLESDERTSISIMKGRFNRNDLMSIISKMIEVKIDFHHSKIQEDLNEEDIERREARIRQLQEDARNLRIYLSEQDRSEFKISANIEIK